jgi:virulence-associated protein VagC
MEMAMERTAKLFKGRNQAVMLPAEFAFDTRAFRMVQELTVEDWTTTS